MAFAVASDGARLHYEVVGRGRAEPVLMIQGLGTDKTGWSLQRLAFAPSFRTIALDNRGSGRSDKPEGPYSLEQMADDADSGARRSGHREGPRDGRVDGGRHRSGARDHLPGTGPIPRVGVHRVSQPSVASRVALGVVERWRAVEGMGALSHQAARWVIGPRSLRRISPLFGWLGPMAMSQPSHAFVAQVDAILAAAESDAAERLAELRVPTLVVVGNQDILTPRGDSEELAERIPGAELVVISGAAHGLMVEHWRPFNRVVGDFWRQVSRSETSAAA